MDLREKPSLRQERRGDDFLRVLPRSTFLYHAGILFLSLSPALTQPTQKDSRVREGLTFLSMSSSFPLCLTMSFSHSFPLSLSHTQSLPVFYLLGSQ